MDSDDDTFDNVDSGNVSSGDDDFPMEVDMSCTKERQSEPEDYPYEVLTTEEIVQHMVDCIKEVNTVVEVSEKMMTQTVVKIEEKSNAWFSDQSQCQIATSTFTMPSFYESSPRCYPTISQYFRKQLKFV